MAKKVASALVGVLFVLSNGAAQAVVPKKSPQPSAAKPALISPMLEYSLSFINGLWDSDWGPVTFKASPRGDGTFDLTGFWMQSNGRGQIQSGNFDPSQGILRFVYYQYWNKATGQAVFRLSQDKRLLNGNWSQSNGGSGGWQLKRPGTWQLPAPPRQAAAIQPQKPLAPHKALPPVAALPPVQALPPVSPLPQISGGDVTVLAIPGSEGAPGIVLRDEGCRKRLTTGADMLFEFDKSDLNESAVNALQVLGDAVKQYGLHPISIEGHTDAIGTDEYNQGLSERRAQTVKQWLLSHNVVSAAAEAVGRGEKQPVAPNTTEDGSDNPPGRALNRRVEVIVDTCKKYGADGVTIEVDEEGVAAVAGRIDPNAKQSSTAPLAVAAPPYSDPGPLMGVILKDATKVLGQDGKTRVILGKGHKVVFLCEGKDGRTTIETQVVTPSGELSEVIIGTIDSGSIKLVK